MQHYAALFHVFDIAKSNKYYILQIDRQTVAVAQHFKNIKLEFSYNIIAWQSAVCL
jgi:hypothetical protein